MSENEYKIGDLVLVDGKEAKIINKYTSYVVAFNNGLTDKVAKDKINNIWNLVNNQTILKYKFVNNDDDILNGNIWIDSLSDEFKDFKFKVKKIDDNKYYLLKVPKDYCSWELVSHEEILKYKINAGNNENLLDGQNWLTSENPEYKNLLFKVKKDKDGNYRVNKVSPDRARLEVMKKNHVDKFFE